MYSEQPLFTTNGEHLEYKGKYNYCKKYTKCGFDF